MLGVGSGLTLLDDDRDCEYCGSECEYCGSECEYCGSECEYCGSECECECECEFDDVGLNVALFGVWLLS